MRRTSGPRLSGSSAAPGSPSPGRRSCCPRGQPPDQRALARSISFWSDGLGHGVADTARFSLGAPGFPAQRGFEALLGRPGRPGSPGPLMPRARAGLALRAAVKARGSEALVHALLGDGGVGCGAVFGLAVGPGKGGGLAVEGGQLFRVGPLQGGQSLALRRGVDLVYVVAVVLGGVVVPGRGKLPGCRRSSARSPGPRPRSWRCARLRARRAAPGRRLRPSRPRRL